jgi:hypothetical protein
MEYPKRSLDCRVGTLFLLAMTKVWTWLTRLFVGFSAVFYTGDQYCVFKDNEEDTVVAHSVFSQACEFTFQFRILLGIPGEILLHFVEDSREVFFADLGEVLGY